MNDRVGGRASAAERDSRRVAETALRDLSAGKAGLTSPSRGFTATQLEIALSRTLSPLSQFGGGGAGTNVNLCYSKDY